MYYRLGHCPLCGIQIMVRNPRGRWATFKPNFRQVDLNFDDGHRVRTILCADCFDKPPEFEKLMEAIICKKSEATREKGKERIKNRGLPKSWSLAPTIQGAALGEKV